MKKSLSVFVFFLAVTILNAQSLDEIVKKYSAANKHDKISSMSTIKITAKMSMMGMDLPMEMWMKNPDKIKTVLNMNGQEIISVIDGTKGYSINPMSGSTTPVEMTSDQLKQSQNSNMFKNQMDTYLKDGKLTLLGEENVNNKPAHKVKADLDGGNSTIMFIDKATYLLTKSTATVNQGGMTITAESYPSDYKEVSGIILPMKTTTSAQGMEMVLTFDKVEVNVPMDDSIFTLK